MWAVLVFALVVASVSCQVTDDSLVVTIVGQGAVRGRKASNYDVFEFLNVPYAGTPRGLDRYKAPLPPPVWFGTIDAIDQRIVCPQDGSLINAVDMNMQEDCLVANIHVPNTNETNLPVLVSAHGGAFLFGWGMVNTNNALASSHNIIVVSFNYRVGVNGFLCLGTEDAPGNAGMKDQVALLRWVQNNIASFGGNPNDVTLYGCSAGGASVDLLLLSSMTNGLFNKVIAESGCSVNPFSAQLDPLQNARNHAQYLGFTNVTDLNALAEFYKTTPLLNLTYSSEYYGAKNAYFTFQPCVEKDIGQPRFLEDAPINILRSGNFKKVPIIYGYAKYEGLFRLPQFDEWSNEMNTDFTKFLPADLQFQNEAQKIEVARQVREFYFGNNLVNASTITNYLDYMSDVIFIGGILRNVALRVKANQTNVYLYEYSFTHNQSVIIPHTDGLRGADHCDQTIILRDISSENLQQEAINMAVTMRQIVYNFITTGNPTPPGSNPSLPTWLPVSGTDGSPHYLIGNTIEVGSIPAEERTRIWDDIYERYGAIPRPPVETNEEDTTLAPETTPQETTVQETTLQETTLQETTAIPQETTDTDDVEVTTAEPDSATRNIITYQFWILYTVVMLIALR